MDIRTVLEYEMHKKEGVFMSLEALKKAALYLVILYFGLRILMVAVPALVTVLGFILRIVFVLMLIAIAWYFAEYRAAHKKS